MKLLYIVSLFLSLICPLENSADVTTQNVLYHSNKRTEKSSGLVTMDLNRLLIKGKTWLEWQDGHSVVKYAFNVKNTTGALSLDKSGEITYQVTSEKVNGRFTVKKANTVIKVTAMLVAEGKPMIIDFEIASYNVID